MVTCMVHAPQQKEMLRSLLIIKKRSNHAITSAQLKKKLPISIYYRQYSSCSAKLLAGARLHKKIFCFKEVGGRVSKYAVIRYDCEIPKGLPDPTFNVFERCRAWQSKKKERRRLHVRTLPSVMDEIKRKVKFISPKNTIQEVRDENGGVMNFTNPAKLPRNRTQAYNASRDLEKPKHRNTGVVKNTDFSKLLTMLSSGRFVKNVTYSKKDQSTENVTPRIFVATDSTQKYI
uniref:Uncharacterized protein n=1 Tax=Clytia hemisphaerica TaxID=252671 RepID=A0A7M5XE08_9CNID|eukprot:TCONS_00063539-protein